RQNTPQANTAVTGGARSAAIALIASKILEYLPPCVDQSMASSITTTALIRPILTWDSSVVFGLIRLTISTATRVAELFNAAAIVLISAASNPAEIRPLSPVGVSWLIKIGRVWLLFFPIRSLNRRYQITPGTTMIKTGSTFKT